MSKSVTGICVKVHLNTVPGWNDIFKITNDIDMSRFSPYKRSAFFKNISEIISIYRLESELPENVCNFFNRSIGFFLFFFRNTSTGPFGVSNV